MMKMTNGLPEHALDTEPPVPCQYPQSSAWLKIGNLRTLSACPWSIKDGSVFKKLTDAAALVYACDKRAEPTIPALLRVVVTFCIMKPVEDSFQRRCADSEPTPVKGNGAFQYSAWQLDVLVAGRGLAILAIGISRASPGPEGVVVIPDTLTGPGW